MSVIRLLWVDDHARALKGLIRPLERAGYTVDIATTIGAAIDRLRSRADYDLLLMDVVLPLVESLPATLVESFEAVGHNRSEGFIVYVRSELRLLLPIVVITSCPDDQKLLARLAPYAISRGLRKGSFTAQELKETLHNVLETVDTLAPILLSLRFGRRSDRESALVNAAHVPCTPALRQTLIDLINTERDAALRSAAIKLIRAHERTGLTEHAHASGLAVDASADRPTVQRGLLLYERADLPAVGALLWRLRRVGPGTLPDLEALREDYSSDGQPPVRLKDAGAVVVCVGPAGDGAWARPGIAAALEMCVRTRACRIIPVLLPGGAVPSRSWARPLYRLQWIDLRDGLATTAAINRLAGELAALNADRSPPSD